MSLFRLHLSPNHLAHRKDAVAEADRGGGARGGARGRACSSFSGGPGIMSAGIMTGARGAPLDVGEAVGGVTPARDGFIHEAWPGSHQGTTHPLGRAVVERRKASCPETGSAAPQGAEVHGPASSGVPYPFCFWRNGKAKRDNEAATAS